MKYIYDNANKVFLLVEPVEQISFAEIEKLYNYAKKREVKKSDD